MGKKRNIQPPPVPIPGRVKIEIKDELGNREYYLYLIFVVIISRIL